MFRNLLSFIALSLYVALAVALIVCLSTGAAFGQEPTTTPEAPPTPVLSDSHRSDYWRARDEVSEALAACKPCTEAQDKLQKAVNALVQDCKTNPVFDAKGEPACPAP